MEPIDIKKWDDLKNGATWSSLLLGNGASIAIHSGFSYGSLLDVANDGGYLPTARSIFGNFATSNFEYVLQALEHTRRVCAELSTPYEKVDAAYREVQNALIESVKQVHCLPAVVAPRVAVLVDFLKSFRTIVSFNYDLTLYWVMLEGNSRLGHTWFKDGFVKGEFVSWWREMRTPNPPAPGATLALFPHGNLVLGRNRSGTEIKLAADKVSNGWDTALLNKITDAWKDGSHAPLFISEGTSSEKLRAIQSSRYLSAVYDQVLGHLGECVVAYGFGFAANDVHVLHAMTAQKRPPQRIAVSVFMGQSPAEQQKFCHDVLSAVVPILKTTRVEFFEHSSAGCWINP